MSVGKGQVQSQRRVSCFEAALSLTFSGRLDRKADVVRDDRWRKAKEQLSDVDVELGVADGRVALEAGAIGKVDCDGAAWESDGRVYARSSLAVGDLDGNIASGASWWVDSDGNGLLEALLLRLFGARLVAERRKGERHVRRPGFLRHSSRPCSPCGSSSYSIDFRTSLLDSLVSVLKDWRMELLVSACVQPPQLLDSP